MLLAKGSGCRVSAMHWRIISWLRCGVRRAALLKRSMNALSGSLCSYLMPRREIVVVWCGRLPTKWVENMCERTSKLSME